MHGLNRVRRAGPSVSQRIRVRTYSGARVCLHRSRILDTGYSRTTRRRKHSTRPAEAAQRSSRLQAQWAFKGFCAAYHRGHNSHAHGRRVPGQWNNSCTRRGHTCEAFYSCSINDDAASVSARSRRSIRWCNGKTSAPYRAPRAQQAGSQGKCKISGRVLSAGGGS